MILATFLGSFIPVNGHCISSQLIGTIGVFEARLHDAANPLAVAVNQISLTCVELDLF